MRSQFLTAGVLGYLALNPIGAHSEEIVQTTVCQVVANPPAFDHRLIELTGEASEGFENFSLSNKVCRRRKNNLTSIWLEYGGRRKSGAKYCCGVSTDRTRMSSLVIDGVITSLVDDENFRAFDARVYPVGEARARIIGRFFAGQRQDAPAGTGAFLWGGYGHFGMSTLLVIQRIVSIEPGARSTPHPKIPNN
jgi:hypothetical protein